MNKLLKSIVLMLIAIVVSIQVYAQTNSTNWSQFRGELRAGTAGDDLSKINWQKQPPQLLWKKEIGEGFSELTVFEDKIFTISSEKTDSVSGLEFLLAIDEKTGKTLWEKELDSIFIDVDGWGDGARSTPLVDENNVYSLSGRGKLSARKKADGSLLWEVDFVKEFGAVIPRWGYATSPLLIENSVIIEVGGKENTAFAAFNKETGKVVWQKAKGSAIYNSPLLAEIENKKQILFANGRTLYSFNSRGDTLWTGKMPFGNITAMPLLVGENKIFLSGVRNPGFCVMEVKDNKANTILTGSSMKNDFNTSCHKDGYIYGFHIAALRCISAETGEVKWTKRGFGKGSLIMVGNKLIVLSDKGKLALVDANPDAYTEKGFVQAIEGKCWTAPSYANGKVFVRNLTQMACFKIK